MTLRPGSFVHGILQARILEWVAMPSSSGIFPTQGSNPGLLHCRQILHHLSHQGSLIICLMPCNLLFYVLFSFRRCLETVTVNSMLIFIKLNTFPSHSKTITKTCYPDLTVSLIQTTVGSTEFLSPYFSCSDSWLGKLIKIFIKYSV